MTKYFHLLAFLLLVIACNPSAKNNNEGKKVLTVTIEPQRFLLEHIVGEAYAVNTLVPAGSNHETYEPAPSVMVELGKSDMYFVVGDLGFENAWTARLSQNNSNVVIVNCSEGIELKDGHHHHHDHDGHQCSHSDIDPHVWTSPSATKIMAKNMLNALLASDAENEEMLRANYDKLIAKIDQTDKIIRENLKSASAHGFMIYHPALGYFADEYGLHQHSIEFEGKNPSPAQIKNLVDVARNEKLDVVFIQKGYDEKNAEVIAKEIGAKVYEIDPLGYDWDRQLIRISSILAGTADE